jgi:hypothetical protein
MSFALALIYGVGSIRSFFYVDLVHNRTSPAAIKVAKSLKIYSQTHLGSIFPQGKTESLRDIQSPNSSVTAGKVRHHHIQL